MIGEPAMAKASATKHRVTYSVHPAVEYLQAIVANLPEKTGRSLDEWLALIKKEGPAGEPEQVKWLKTKHRLGGTTAGLIAERAQGKGQEHSDGALYLREAAAYVEVMYEGPKADLWPLHDALIELVCSLADDVKICPCATIVPFYRHHVFAQIKPTTRTRIDLGLALKGAKQKIPKRLIDTGGLQKGDRITHRIPITAPADIDAEVREWAKIAYELDKAAPPSRTAAGRATVKPKAAKSKKK
jgi:Domain of unknown function (DUF5655)/Domain of unknown function (DUF4287)